MDRQRKPVVQIDAGVQFSLLVQFEFPDGLGFQLIFSAHLMHVSYVLSLCQIYGIAYRSECDREESIFIQFICIYDNNGNRLNMECVEVVCMYTKKKAISSMEYNITYAIHSFWIAAHIFLSSVHSTQYIIYRRSMVKISKHNDTKFNFVQFSSGG